MSKKILCRRIIVAVVRDCLVFDHDSRLSLQWFHPWPLDLQPQRPWWNNVYQYCWIIYRFNEDSIQTNITIWLGCSVAQSVRNSGTKRTPQSVSLAHYVSDALLVFTVAKRRQCLRELQLTTFSSTCQFFDLLHKQGRHVGVFVSCKFLFLGYLAFQDHILTMSPQPIICFIYDLYITDNSNDFFFFKLSLQRREHVRLILIHIHNNTT